MCLTCGCNRAHDSHGDPAHLTLDHLKASANADGIGLKEAVKRLKVAVKADRKDHPQEHQPGSPPKRGW